jgi:large subunit ribosomal protein L23
VITCYDIIKTLVRTEKGTMLEPDRKYLFHVAKSSNKIEIKKAVEEIYKVKVQDVNTTIVRGKLKRVRQEQGSTTPWKKAIVTLKVGQKIEAT